MMLLAQLRGVQIFALAPSSILTFMLYLIEVAPPDACQA